MIEPKKIGGIGSSEIGKLFTRDGMKSKTAQTLALEKAIEIVTGERERISTIAMQHGIFSEEEAYYNVIAKDYPESKYQSSESIFLDDKEMYSIWTTPDVVCEDITIDIKCPYTPYQFHKQRNKPPKSYIMQNQMQMMGTGHNKGALLYYLTSPDIDKYGNKLEYDIPVHMRSHYYYLDADSNIHEDVMNNIAEFWGVRDKIVEIITGVPELNDADFFKFAEFKKVTRYKEKSNLLTWSGKVYKYRGRFYTIE